MNRRVESRSGLLLGRSGGWRVSRLIGWAMVLMAAGCRHEAKNSDEQAVESSLPGAERAAAAAERVRPALTRDLEAKDLAFGAPVFLRAFKQEKVLEVWVQHRDGDFRLFRSYPIAGSSGRLGPKRAEGDWQVPEGFYHFTRSSMKPDSRYHLAFNIGYPNAYDRYHDRTGSFIMVHGNRISVGCLAMTDTKIEEIYTLCDAAMSGGQPFIRIHLFPFRMSDQAMKRHGSSEWQNFWQNLREGYQYFEREKRPPNTHVEGGRYVFEEAGE